MLEGLYKFVAIALSLLIFAQAYSIRMAVGTYIFPACLFALAWFLFTFLPLVILFDVPVNPISILYLFNCVSAFSLGALPFNWRYAFEANKSKSLEDYSKFDSRLIIYLFVISGVSSIMFSTISVTTNGFELSSLMFNLLETSGRYAALRGNGYLEYNVWGVLSTFFTYATPIFGGLIYQQRQKYLKKSIILSVAFIPSLYFMLTQSAKLIIFYSIGFYFGSVLLKKIYLNKLDLFNKTFLFRLMVGILLFIPLVLISFISREGYYEYLGSDLLYGILAYSVKSYAFGQVYAFSDFLSEFLGSQSQLTYVHDYGSYGWYTLTSVMDLFGDKYFPPGTFYDSYAYKDFFATNIFTLFRGLIYDFGGFGSIVFMFVCGLIAHAFFYILLTSRSSWSACSVFIITVVFIQGSYLVSILMARYTYLLLLAFILIFYCNDQFCKYKSKRQKLLTRANRTG